MEHVHKIQALEERLEYFQYELSQAKLDSQK